LQLLFFAFFSHLCRASINVMPRSWVAKSSTVVVPPTTAAFVPVTKSSAVTVAPTSRSKWVWVSMNPGNT